MTTESPKEFYDRQYGLHQHGQIVCPSSLHDLRKANRRVNGVQRAFGLVSALKGAEVLDVGCGLGYYTKALSAKGARVTGMDFSQVGVAAAAAAFSDCRFICAAWPDGIEPVPRFDLIWAVNFSLVNTFDVHAVDALLVQPAMDRLKVGGHLIIGWNTNLSGRALNNYCQWSMAMLQKLREVCRFSEPIVAEAPAVWLSRMMLLAGRVLSRGIPIFLARRKDAKD